MTVFTPTATPDPNELSLPSADGAWSQSEPVQTPVDLTLQSFRPALDGYLNGVEANNEAADSQLNPVVLQTLLELSQGNTDKNPSLNLERKAELLAALGKLTETAGLTSEQATQVATLTSVIGGGSTKKPQAGSEALAKIALEAGKSSSVALVLAKVMEIAGMTQNLNPKYEQASTAWDALTAEKQMAMAQEMMGFKNKMLSRTNIVTVGPKIVDSAYGFARAWFGKMTGFAELGVDNLSYNEFLDAILRGRLKCKDPSILQFVQNTDGADAKKASEISSWIAFGAPALGAAIGALGGPSGVMLGLGTAATLAGGVKGFAALAQAFDEARFKAYEMLRADKGLNALKISDVAGVQNTVNALANAAANNNKNFSVAA
jgi:hypothetical protein